MSSSLPNVDEYDRHVRNRHQDHLAGARGYDRPLTGGVSDVSLLDYANIRIPVIEEQLLRLEETIKQHAELEKELKLLQSMVVIEPETLAPAPIDRLQPVR